MEVLNHLYKLEPKFEDEIYSIIKDFQHLKSQETDTVATTCQKDINISWGIENLIVDCINIIFWQPSKDGKEAQ